MIWAICAILTPIYAVCTVIGIFCGKRVFMKMPVLVAGFPKKNRIAVRDGRLKPALWRSRFWLTLLLVELCFPAGMAVGIGLALGDWRPAAIAAAVCLAAAVPIEIMRRKRWRGFLAEAEALGVELTRNPEAVKEAVGEAYGNFSRSYGKLYIFLIAIMALNMALQLAQKAWLHAGLFAACAVSFLALLIYMRVKGKRK